MIELQREYRARSVTYARKVVGILADKPVFGEEICTPKGYNTRAQIKADLRETRRQNKREATRTAKQRRASARNFGIELLLMRLKIAGHDTVLHPDNPYVDISLRRKLRKQGKGKILTGAPVIEAAAATQIVTPKDLSKPPEPKKDRLGGLKRRASGLFVPVKDRLK